MRKIIILLAAVITFITSAREVDIYFTSSPVGADRTIYFSNSPVGAESVYISNSAVGSTPVCFTDQDYPDAIKVCILPYAVGATSIYLSSTPVGTTDRIYISQSPVSAKSVCFINTPSIYSTNIYAENLSSLSLNQKIAILQILGIIN